MVTSKSILQDKPDTRAMASVQPHRGGVPCKWLWAVAWVCLGVPCAVALEATWVNTNNESTKVQYYTNAVNWVNRATGEAVDVAPTNAGDVAWFDASMNCWQRIRLADIQTEDGTNHLGTIHGLWNTRLWTATDSINTFHYYTYLFDDINDFQGSLYPDRSGVTFAFTGKNTDVHIADLSTRLGPTLAVPGGTTVTVDGRHEGGAIKTAGAGTVKLAESAVPDSQIIYHNAGRLELVGHPDGVVSVPGDPVFWVDGSKLNTMDLADVDANGRRFINAWRDCRAGDGVHTFAATPINNNAISRPWISSETLNGLTTVNFGCYYYGKSADEPERYGPQASLGYDFKANAREYFIVWRDVKDDAYTTSFVVGQTGTYDFHRGEMNGHIFWSSVNAQTKNSLMRLDGAAAQYSTVVAPGRFHLLNVCLLGNGSKPTTFFNDRITTRIGGGYLAEAIFYTNVLTQAERTQVERYLQEKWFGQAADAEVIKAASRATPVSVPTDNVAKVRQIVVDGESLVKEGAGVLKVGRFQPDSPTIDVAGGAVAFDADQPMVTTAAPATNALIWLDATQDTLSLAPANGTNFVTKWSDCRAGWTGYASAMAKWNNPFVSTDTCNGLRVIDFGEKDNAGTKAAMQMSYTNDVIDDIIIEAFQVVKLPVKNSNQNIFGSSKQALLRENTSTLLHTTHAYMAPGAGLWTMNGVTVDPYAPYPIDPNTWYVASFSSEVNLNCGCGYLAYDRGGKIGDQRIGEFIGYDRRLTDAERRQTIAYLMKKWKGVDYAYAKAPAAIGQMNFTAANNAPTIVADADTEITSVTFAGQTSLTKTGAGALTIGSSIPCTISNLSIEGACTIKGPISPFPDAAFHVDAMRADTFTFAANSEVENGIDKWYDCRGNGLYAQSVVETFKEAMTTNASLASSGASGEGGLLANRPYVDFGTNAGMFWYDANGTKMELKNTREYHVVFCITAAGNHQPISGSLYPSKDQSLCPASNTAKEMFWNSGCPIAIGAAKRTDGGAWYTGNAWNAEGTNLSTTKFYVQSFQATNDVAAYSFAIDRNTCGRGYVKLCEALVFTGATNTTERANAIHAYLLNKWKGVGDNPIAIDLNQVTIAAGGSLALTSSVPLSVAKLSGGGELKIPGGSLTGLASVTAGFDAAGAVMGMKVSGNVTFAPQVEVAVSVANPRVLEEGVYTIFSADSFANADAVTFNFTVDNPGLRRFYFHLEDSAIRLQVAKKGIVIHFR